jgi:hypothetical protein
MTRVTVSKKERKRVAKVKEGGKFEEAGLGGGWDDIRGLGAEMHQVPHRTVCAHPARLCS